MLKNATVALTYYIKGAITNLGKYDYKERSTSGSILEEYRRLFTSKYPAYSKCYKKVNLSEAFVNHALSKEGRPKRGDSFHAYTFWRCMTPVEKLHWHIAKFTGDMGSSDYSYQIQEL